MKVIRLVVKQIKGVRRVDVLAHPNCNEIAGANGAGKSSVLDSIVWALAGKRAIDSKPLRDGAEKGEIIVETERFTARRSFSENGDTRLTIEPKDGSKIGQRDLDGLFSEFSFDPLAFSRMKPADQVSLLQRLAGPGFVARLAELDAQIEEATAERTAAKRAMDRLGALATVEYVEPVDVTAASSSLAEAERHNSKQAQRAAQLAQLRERLAQAEALVASLEQQIDAAPEPEPTRDTDELRRLLVAAAEQNRRAQEHAEFVRRVEERAVMAREANEAEERLAALREDRKALQTSVRLPVDGVAFGEAGLRVNGLPFDQLSSSERIRISARIGMALGPELRVMFVKDGSLLDDRSFAELRDLAAASDYQLWVETVGAGHGDAIVLEAGEVASIPLARAEAF